MDETARKKMWADYAKTRQADIREKNIFENETLVNIARANV